MSVTPSSHRTHSHGFTIVELLIVIVVIAILASITIVAYNGIRQRANNTAIISATSQIYKLVAAYVSTNGTYPDTSAGGCIILPPNLTKCSSGSPNNNGLDTTAVNALKTIGTVPISVPKFNDNFNGALYLYDIARTMNGQPAPVVLVYYLDGSNINCGGFGVVANDSGGNTMVTSSTPYTRSSSGVTTCVISIPGPAA